MNSEGRLKNAREQLIIALDLPRADAAIDLARILAGDVSFFKIGLQLYTAAGPEIVRAIAATGARIFLDLKLHDIPNTVAKAVTAAAELKVAMLTIHLSGGSRMVEAAVAAAPPELLLLGVTVLTSSDEATLLETGINRPVAEQALRLAQLGAHAGIRGLVASPHEVVALRQALPAGMSIVTPGVRPSWAAADDQKRFTTPREAIQNGADYLVIGRPVTAHADPREAVRVIVSEVAGS
ncbi:MAG: orotidine-5'-phosphate decarboxylase [Chthoniobacterales bacterium]|nr:orotidine-5'-phosphate decarboxylase [Chthoniobacterales bacterium]